MTIPVTIDNFARAETALMFSRLVADTGAVNTWVHYREPAPLDHQPIIRQNRDTLYSAAIVDVSAGATVELPAGGERYLSVMVVNEDHYIPTILHAAGRHELLREEVGSDHVLLGVRILVDPTDAADVAAVNRLQDQLVLRSRSALPFAPADYDPDSLARTRTSLLALAEGLPDFRHGFGRAEDVDPRRHLVVTAAGWGGLPETEADYINVNPGLPIGEYAMTVRDVPVDAFWSISLYNAEGFFVPSDHGLTNVNSVTGAREEDGSVIVRFGPDGRGRENYLTVMDGWNFLMRLYRPRAEILDGTWQPPEIRPVES